MSFGVLLDMSMDGMEETRFKKKHSELIQRLSKKLHFSYTELECLFLIYYHLQKDGPDKQPGINKNQFRDVMHSGLDMTDNNMIDRVLYSMDKGPSPIVSMEVWANAMSLFMRGTLEEKINYCFSAYDLMGQGVIGRDSMFQFLRTCLIGQGTEDDAEEAARDLIEVITKKMDLDRDGRISFNDFKTSIMNQPLMLEAFGQCLPSRLAVHSFLTSFTEKVGKL